MTDPNPNPDLMHMERAVQWLLARSARLGEALRVEDDQRPRALSWDHRTLGLALPQVACEQSKLRLDGLRKEEQQRREDMDAWLTTYRGSGKPTLGIDALCKESGLQEDERTILLTACAVAINDGLAKQILEPLGGGMLTRLDVQSAVQLLDPPDIAACVWARRYFTRTAPLIRDGLLTIEYPTKECPPGDVMSSTLMVSSKAFSTIVGEPLEGEISDGPDTPDERR